LQDKRIEPQPARRAKINVGMLTKACRPGLVICHCQTLLLPMRSFLFCMLLVLQMHSIAQADSNYISSFRHKNYLQLYAGEFSRKIMLVPKTNRRMQHEISFSPNSSAFAGFVLGYKKFTLYGDIAIPKTSIADRRQSNVKAIALFLNHFKNNLGITFFGSYNKGLLMAQDNSNMMYGDRNDIRMFTGGAHIYRIFNSSKFSYNAANSQQMLQKKSSGSFIILTTPSYRIIKAGMSIVPEEISKYHFTGVQDMYTRIAMVSLQVRPGFAYNFVFKKGLFFIAPAVFAGAGADYHRINATNQQHRSFNINTGYRVKLVTGMNHKRFFTTAEFLIDRTFSHIYQSIISNRYSECSVNAGWRF
jgi:hypothetical protein